MSRKIGAIQAAKDVLDKGWYGTPAKRRIDATSANLVVQCADKLNDKHKAELDALTIHQAAALCWKLVSK